MKKLPKYKMMGWHMLPSDCRLTYGDGRKVEVGKTLSAFGVVAVCENGLHACKKLWDCLLYTNGDVITRVQLSNKKGDGRLQHHSVKGRYQKAAGQSRKCLGMWNINDNYIIRNFLLQLKKEGEEYCKKHKKTINKNMYRLNDKAWFDDTIEKISLIMIAPNNLLGRNMLRAVIGDYSRLVKKSPEKVTERLERLLIEDMKKTQEKE